MRARLRDVAELAGTSTAVVSYVVNGGPRTVSEETRRRVEDAIEQLAYRPNRVAQSLRTGRSSTVGLVVPDLTKGFFAEMAAAVERAAMAGGQRLLISTAQFDTAREQEQIHALLDAQVDALVLVPTAGVDPSLALMRRAGVPWLLMHRHPTEDLGDVRAVVGADLDAGRAAAAHLLQHGHRQVACLASPGTGAPVQQRLTGFREAMTEAGAPVPDDLVLDCGYADMSGAAHVETLRLLREHPGVSAICAMTDEHAYGVYRAADEAGRRIGEDLAVMSIDGTSHSAYLVPSLTVLATPFDEMATTAMRVLLEPAGDADLVHALPLALVVRRSCGC